MVRGLREVKAEASLGIPPRYFGRVGEGVADQLNGFVLRYVEELRGVVLAYWGVKNHQDTAPLLSAHADTMVLKVSVSFLVYCIEEDAVLQGVVKEQSKDHVNMLLIGDIDAHVSMTGAQEDTTFNQKSHTWEIQTETGVEQIKSKGIASIQVESYASCPTVAAHLVSIAFEKEYMQVRGKLVPSSAAVEPDAGKDTSKKRREKSASKKKRQKV